MTKRIGAFALALLMVLSLVLAVLPAATPAAAAETGPVTIKVHYHRNDNNYTDWDIYTWGDTVGGGHALVEENGEMVATLYANANTSSIGFIVRKGGDSWTAKDWSADRFIQNGYEDLYLVESGTLHVYLESGVEAFTVVEENVVKSNSSEVTPTVPGPVAIQIHYTRADGNYEGWNIFQWGGVEVTSFEVGENEAVATIYANANTESIGFIVRYSTADNEWAGKETTDLNGGDRMVETAFPRLSEVESGTIHLYVDSANPTVTTAVAGDDVVYTGEEPEPTEPEPTEPEPTEPEPTEPEEDETEAPGAVKVKVHYTREDGNYEGWDVFQWGGQSVTAFEVAEDGSEAVATIYANSNSGDIGFIVRYGGDSWTDREWADEGKTTGDRTVSGLSDIVTGTVHVYVDHANPSETVIELGDDVIYTGDEHINVMVHYTREDGEFDGWDVFQWGGQSATAFEKVSDTEAVSTIHAYSNSGDIGFIVRYGGDSWTDREWADEGKTTGDRTVTGLADIFCGTVHVYVDHANPTETRIVLDTVAYGTGEPVEYDITINVHYYREDGNYADWEVHMWNGVESLSSTRTFADEMVSYDGKQWKVTTYYADASDTWVGFIIKTPAWTKDPDGDRHIDISDVTGGTVNVYAVSGSALEDFVTDKSQATLGAKVTAAVYDYKTSTIEVTTSYPLENVTVDTFTLEGPDGQMTISAVEVIDDYTYMVTYEGEITELNVYTLYYNGVPCVVTIPNTYSTEEFEAEYTYTGDDLGANWTAEGTTFRLWAPTAAAVSVNLYASGTQGTDDLIATYEMTADVNGTWVVAIPGDHNGIYYTYSVTRKGETVEAVDPYARTTGVNGNRAMIIDLDSTDPAGWENDTYVTVDNYTDAVIWELHVRDFSIDASSGVSDAIKGKYLAFTEEGTTVPGTDISTGVDYMVDLGVNYVHLLPVYDINSVDETTGGYNWGYDPKNYNVPEGSYSTDPYNGAVRVTEFKQMVQSLHDNGIGVIMDVVYNHVADAGTFCFNQIVPGYFSRIHDDGSYQSNSGCGNDTASERSMVRKYIVDSVLYWAEEYHIDGFRWDLVGLIDYETINQVMAEVHAVNPDIIFYGEGWDMCTWTTKEDQEVPYSQKMTIQNNDEYFNTEAGTFALFNDTIRNVIHGGVFTATDKGFVSGNMNEGTYQTVVDGYMANSTWGTSGGTVDTPLQTINYASCHDNYTLFDNLTIDAMDATGLTAAEVAEQAAAMNNLAAAYYITAQGVPFVHAGEEMLRSKPDSTQENGFNHNSYASGDEINSIKWSTLADELVANTYAYYQGLIAFRAAHPALRMTTEAEVLAAMSVLETGSTNVVAVLNKGGNGEDAEIISIFNADSVAHTVTLPEGTWEVHVDKDTAGTTCLYTVEGTVEVEATGAMILVKAEEETEADVTFISASISLDGTIGVNFYVQLSEKVTSDPEAKVVFTYGENTVAVALADAIKSGENYVFTCPVAAKEMTEEVTAQVHVADGAIGEPKSISVKGYAEQVLALEDARYESVKPLLKAMLNYGAAAQVQFGHNVDNLANSSLDEAEKALPETVDVSAYAPVIAGAEEGIRARSATLLLESDTVIRFYFELTGSKTIEEYTFTVNGETLVPVASGSQYYVDCIGVAARDLDTAYTLTVGGLSVTYSGLSYVYQIQNYAGATDAMRNVVKALYAYNQAANAYFGA